METKLIDLLKRKEWRGVKPLPSGIFKQTSSNVLPDQLVGIEIEAENFGGYNKTNKVLEAWNITTDGSLRNNGIEFVSNPLQVSIVSDALRELFSNQLSKLDFSRRTSIHVHMNVRDMRYCDFINLIKIYICFEYALFRFAGDFRRKSIFCVPIQETSLLQSTIKSSDFFFRAANPWMKYSAFNLSPVSTQGTVEFRHMQGTQNISYITDWIDILCCLRKYAESIDPEKLDEKLMGLLSSSEYHLFANDVFGVWTDTLFSDNRFPLKEIDNAVKYIKANMYSIHYKRTPPEENGPLYKAVGKLVDDVRLNRETKKETPKNNTVLDENEVEEVIQWVEDSHPADDNL